MSEMAVEVHPRVTLIEVGPNAVRVESSLQIGTVTGGDSPSDYDATITGTAPNRFLNLKLPRGPVGPTAYEEWLTQGNTGSFDDFMAQYVEVEIPARLAAAIQQGPSDLNLATTSGWSSVSNDAGRANGPAAASGAWWIVNYVGNVNDGIQTLYDWNAGVQYTYRRNLIAGVWTAWERLVDTKTELDSLYLNIGEGIQDSMLPARLGQIAQVITDWNDAIENGWYLGPEAANGPLVGYFVGHTQVQSSTAWVRQEVFRFVGNGQVETYERVMEGGGWGAWQRVYRSAPELDARYLNIGEGITDEMLPPRLGEYISQVTNDVTDPDLALATGWYNWSTSSVNTQLGINPDALLEVIAHSENYLVQFAHSTISGDTGRTWRRRRANGAWTDWAEILDKDQSDSLYLNIGEGITNSMLPARLRHRPDRIFDWDTAIAPGWYHTAFEDGAANAPYVAHWFGMVEAGWSDNAWAVQTIYEMTGGDANAPIVSYQRRRYADSWGAWHRIYDTETELDARYINNAEEIANDNLPVRLKEGGMTIDNWDAAVTNGWYAGNNAANAPESGWLHGRVEQVAANPDYVTQYVMTHVHGADNTGRTYRRIRDSGTWTPWVRVYDTEAELDSRYRRNASLGDAGSLVQTDMRIPQNPANPLSLPVGWNDYSNNGGQAYGESAENKSGSGGRYLVLKATSAGTGGAVSDFFPVGLGGRYKFGADMWYAGQYPNIILRVDWYDGNKNYLFYNDVYSGSNEGQAVPAVADNTAPHTVIGGIAAPPTNGKYCRVILLNVSNGVGDSFLAIINPRVDKVSNHILPSRLGGNRMGTAEHLNEVLGNDWNFALQTGFYMSDNAANAPGAGWYIGEVVAHNTSWVTQEVWAFTDPNPSANRWRRHCNNGNWGSWQKVAPTGLGNYFDAGLATSDANTALVSGVYYVNNVAANIPVAFWGFIRVEAQGAEVIQEYRGMGAPFPKDSGAHAQVYRRFRNGSGVWSSWVQSLIDLPDQDSRFGRFGFAYSNKVGDPNLATAPGVYDWEAGGHATAPNKVFALDGNFGCQLVVTCYDGSWIKQEARVWDSDQKWVRFHNGGAGIWGEWVHVPNRTLDFMLGQAAANSSSGRNLVFNGRFDYVTSRIAQVYRNISTLRTSVPGWQGPLNASDSGWLGDWVLGGSNGSGGLSLGLRATNNVGEGVAAISDPIPVEPGKTYRWRFRVWSDVAIPSGIYMGLQGRRNLKRYVGQSDDLLLAIDLVANVGHVGGQFTAYEGYYTIPAGEIHAVTLQPVAWAGSNPNGTNTIYFTDIEFEEVIPTAALGDSGWQAPSAYYNNWGPLNDSTWPVRYRKIGNRVTLKGLLSGGVVSSSGEAGMALALPPGYRPFSEIHTPVANNASATDTGHSGVCRIFTNGSLQIISGANQWVSLDNISFLVD